MNDCVVLRFKLFQEVMILHLEFFQGEMFLHDRWKMEKSTHNTAQQTFMRITVFKEVWHDAIRRNFSHCK